MPEPKPVVVHSTPVCEVLQAQLGGWDNLNHLIVCTATKAAVVIDPVLRRLLFQRGLELGPTVEHELDARDELLVVARPRHDRADAVVLARVRRLAAIDGVAVTIADERRRGDLASALAAPTGHLPLLR